MFGLFAGMVFAISSIFMMMLTAAFEQYHMVLWVHVLKQGAIAAKPDGWTEPLIWVGEGCRPRSETAPVPKLKDGAAEKSCQRAEERTGRPIS